MSSETTEVETSVIKSDCTDEATTSSKSTNAVAVQILIPDLNVLEGQWLNTGLTLGSQIQVSNDLKSISYWIWERTSNSDDTTWSFRPNRISNIYIGYDESSSNLVMRHATDRSYFTVRAGDNGGFTFRLVGNETKYIGMEHGKLSLTSASTEWSISLEEEFGSRDPNARKDIVIVKDDSTNRKWVVDFPVPHSHITVAMDHQNSKTSQWVSEFDVTNAAWKFRPILNRRLFITVDVEKGSITLQPASNSTERGRLIKGVGVGTVIMSDMVGNYFTVDSATSRLVLNRKRTFATSWSFYIYGFEIGGHPFPSGILPTNSSETNGENEDKLPRGNELQER